jgi:hypothetical protein
MVARVAFAINRFSFCRFPYIEYLHSLLQISRLLLHRVGRRRNFIKQCRDLLRRIVDPDDCLISVWNIMAWRSTSFNFLQLLRCATSNGMPTVWIYHSKNIDNLIHLY